MYSSWMEIKDITIIGGGPTGIFALFYAGMRSATAQVVDALPELGGQLTVGAAPDGPGTRAAIDIPLE